VSFLRGEGRRGLAGPHSFEGARGRHAQIEAGGLGYEAVDLGLRDGGGCDVEVPGEVEVLPDGASLLYAGILSRDTRAP
jgi:hypothetical protein